MYLLFMDHDEYARMFIGSIPNERVFKSRVHPDQLGYVKGRYVAWTE